MLPNAFSFVIFYIDNLYVIGELIMSNFESPLGNRKFGASGPAMREFNVPDESVLPEIAKESVNPVFRRRMGIDQSAITDFQNKIAQSAPQQTEYGVVDAEREFREAREARKNGKEKITDGAKRRIEMLLNMTRSTREFSFAGNSFVLQTLKAKEAREAIVAASEFAVTVQESFEVRRQFLARSLTQVAGVDIDQFLGSNSLETRLAFIEELDDFLINRLYDEYLLLRKDAMSKYAINTADEAKEVMEDLKK
jgi:hypothetical protein